ncbi:MAG TPA: glycerol-3-phosphate dehydrogenase/oxidase [bacterium]
MLAPRLERERLWEGLQRGCDVLVVGGGITGAGVALDAASRGYRVVLVERADYASGTSSRSTKLVHGGLRYLPQWQFGLVREALRERERLRTLAPHLVSPLSFVVPLYRETKRPLGIPIPGAFRWATALGVGFGLSVYDLLSRSDLRSRRLTAAQASAAFPGLRTDTLRAAFLYHDAATDDVRLTHAVLATARRFGAVTMNYVEVIALAAGQPPRVTLKDRLSGASVIIEARHVVNAAGVWAESIASLGGAPEAFRIERSKGVHLVLDAPHALEHALVIPETDDGRLAFAVPWRGRLILGTTDDPYAGELDDPTVTAAEAAYLLDHFNRYLTEPVRVGNVIGAYAGLRPLVRRGASRTAALSRSHEVVDHANGLVSIIGGKLTTYRQMAEDAVNVIIRRDGRRTASRTRTLILDGGEQPDDTLRTLAASEPDLGLPVGTAGHLYRTYGARGGDILDVARREGVPSALVGELPVLAAEVTYACRAEQLISLADFMFLRSRLAILDRDHGRAALPRIAALMAAELGWSASEQNRQIAAYETALVHETAFSQLPEKVASRIAT